MLKKLDHQEAGSTFTYDRRSGKDRRNQRFGDIRWLLKTGRRRRVRRESDRRKLALLDHYPSELFYTLIAVLFLSVVDAFLTLWLIDKGAMEINPVMAYYLSLGPYIFLTAKYLLTTAVVVIVVLMNYTIVRFFTIEFGQLLKLFAGCFGLVVAWELYLIAQTV